VKDSTSNKPLDFPTFEFSERYCPQITSQSTSDPTHTSSPNTIDPHQESSSNEEIRGVTLKEPLYHIPNPKVSHLCHHNRTYRNSIGQIPIIYQIPIYCAS
jgi:hypothetical protein